MWRFSSGTKKAFEKVQERDSAFRKLKEHAAAGLLSEASLCTLVDYHVEDPSVPDVLGAIIDALMKRNNPEIVPALHYLLNGRDFGDENKNSQYRKIQQIAAEKAFGLAARLNENSAKDMGAAAGLAGAISKVAAPGSYLEVRALCLWERAVDILAAKDVGSYASTINNAMCGGGSCALTEAAIERCEKILTGIEQGNSRSAVTLAEILSKRRAELEVRRQAAGPARQF